MNNPQRTKAEIPAGESAAERFPVVCLVGSVKQVDEWRDGTARLTAAGCVVLEAGLYGTMGWGIDENTWELVTRVHWQKIRMADAVVVILKPDGSWGKHTAIDIEYGRDAGKPIIWLTENMTPKLVVAETRLEMDARA